MEEITIEEYISKKKISIKEVYFERNLNHKIFYTKFSDIYVNPKLWSVITKDFYIFSNFERYLSTFKHSKEIILREKEIKMLSKSMPQIKGNFFLFGGEDNYWHFMIDFMPRLYCLKYLPTDNLSIIIPNNLPQKFVNFVIKFCNYLEIKKISFFQINRENLIYSFEKLVFTSRPSILFTTIFFRKFIQSSINNKMANNLYVKRGDTKNRKVLNEDELIKLLRKYDYDIIDCANLSIEEQINHFSNAKNIIIPSGAAMANLLFVNDKINVVEIRSNLDGDFSKKINLNSRFNLYLFEKTTKVGQKLRKDIIVDLVAIAKLIDEKRIF